MTEKKKYLIELLLKCSKTQEKIIPSFEHNAKILRSMYKFVSDEDFEKVIDEHGINKYMEGMASIIDNSFTEEEIDELIIFYRSNAMQKIIGEQFSSQVGALVTEIVENRDIKLNKLFSIVLDRKNDGE